MSAGPSMQRPTQRPTQRKVADGSDCVPADLQAAVLRCAGPDLAADLAFRPMFGGIMGYARGRPFASLSNVGLALKLGPADRNALLAEPGAAPLRYEPDSPPSRQYVVVPRAMLDAPGDLIGWLERSVAHVLAPPRKPPRKAGAGSR